MSDNLESFFKNRLNEEVEEESWNMPSDRVWDKVAPEIQKESGIFLSWRKILVILSSITAIVLLTVTSFFIFNNYNDSVENKLVTDKQENDIDNIKADKSEITNSSGNSATIDSDSHVDSKSKTYGELSNDLNSNYLNKSDQSKSKDVTVKEKEKIDQEESVAEIQKVNEVGGDDSDNTNIDKSVAHEEFSVVPVSYSAGEESILQNNNKVDFYTESEKTEKETTEINKISEVEKPLSPGSNVQKVEADQKVNQAVIGAAADKSMLSEVNNLEAKPVDLRGKIGLGFYYSPSYTATYVTGDMSNGLEKTPLVFLYSTDYGVDLKFNISNKLAIVTGLSKTEIKSWSKSSVTFNYDLSTQETMPDGEKSNTTDIPMPTPFGNVGTSVTYQFPGSANIPDGEAMESYMDTHQHVQYFSIPVGVEYRFVNKPKFCFTGVTGIRFNKSILDGSTFTSRVVHNGDDMDVVSEYQTYNPDYKKYYFNYYLGVGFNYNLGKSLSFYSSLRYMGNIDAVNNQNNLRTNMHEISPKIGLMYIF